MGILWFPITFGQHRRAISGGRASLAIAVFVNACPVSRLRVFFFFFWFTAEGLVGLLRDL